MIKEKREAMKYEYQYRIDEKTGKVELLNLEFPYKCVEIPHDEIYRKVYSYSLIKIDLSRAIYYLERTKVEKDPEMKEGLFRIAVILYAKCFLPPRHGGRSQLGINIYDNIFGEPKKCHEIFMQMRHKYVAHDEGDYKEAKVGAVLNLNTSSLHGIFSVKQQSAFAYDDSIDILLNLCTIAHNKADEFFNKALAEIYGEINTRSFDKLSSYSEMSIQVEATQFQV